ncbi:hypothetical protein LTR10_004557 [Elasticomyces elasticus]|nr:hypothetical protein LTR10_004557 [Elasticomyces elasticus]KAK4976877.1 hypothetical protein LTR42_002922 [Elasticomyces elasticus]
MRLLNTTTLEFEEFFDTQQVKYSILSHCWSQDPRKPEVSHQAYLSKTYNKSGAGYQKIIRCCKLSRERGLGYTWVDTCCVDKTSSTELSETINSSASVLDVAGVWLTQFTVFRWYRESAECYVFMDDLGFETLPKVAELTAEGRWMQDLEPATVADVDAFVENRWFSRGWTLQELLAPRSVLFYNDDTHFLGSKQDLAPLIAHASGIHADVINGSESIFRASIAQRMSWASARRATRREDIAYCLLGIFEVNMPLLYGEGDKAFMRLQEAILRQSNDQSIFAWGLNKDQRHLTSVLAAAPSAFKGSGNILRGTGRMRHWERTNDRLQEMWDNSGYPFAEMVGFDLVKEGLQIRHRNVLSSDDAWRVSINLKCSGLGGKASETILHMRLDLQKDKYGHWQRARIAHRDTRARKWLDAYAEYRPPRVLCVWLGHDINPSECASQDPASDYVDSLTAWITFWMKMVPAQTLAIFAFASLAVELNASNSASDRATQWFLMDLVALALASYQDTVIRMGRRLILGLILESIPTSVLITLRAVSIRLRLFFMLLLKHYFGQDHETLPVPNNA